MKLFGIGEGTSSQTGRRNQPEEPSDASAGREAAPDEAIWKSLLGSDKTDFAASVAQLGITETEFLTAATADVVSRAKAYRSGWFASHWFDLMVCAVLLLAFAAAAGSLAHTVAEPCKARLVALKDLEPFVPVRGQDISAETCAADPNTKWQVNSLAGKYPVFRIEKDKEVNVKDFSARALPTDIPTHYILPITVRNADATKAWSLPVKATLIASPRIADSGDALIIPGAYVLHANFSGTSGTVWVALPDGEMKPLAARLGSSDLFLARNQQ